MLGKRNFDLSSIEKKAGLTIPSAWRSFWILGRATLVAKIFFWGQVLNQREQWPGPFKTKKRLQWGCTRGVLGCLSIRDCSTSLHSKSYLSSDSHTLHPQGIYTPGAYTSSGARWTRIKNSPSYQYHILVLEWLCMKMVGARGSEGEGERSNWSALIINH